DDEARPFNRARSWDAYAATATTTTRQIRAPATTPPTGWCFPGERRLFRRLSRLSVFAGSFDIDASESVCAGGDTGAAGLTNRSYEPADFSSRLPKRTRELHREAGRGGGACKLPRPPRCLPA